MSRRGFALVAVVALAGAIAGTASAATVSWSVPALVDHQPPLATTPAIQGVACPSAHLCVGLEGEAAVTSANPLGGRRTWRVTSFLGIRGYSGAGFGALACAPATRFCVAADGVGDLVATTNPAGGARSWKLTRLPRRMSFSALSCPTARLCFALDNGTVLYSRNPARARSWRGVRLVAGDAALRSISCPTAHSCAVTAAGSITAQILTSANPTGGRRAWRATHLSWERTDFAFSSVSCPSVRFCVAGDAWGNIFTSTRLNRRRWQRTRLDGRSRSFDARNLSCPSVRLCVSVSIAGIASSTRPAGGAKTWTIRAFPTPLDGVATVGCVRSLCVAGDSGDNLLATARPAAGVSEWRRSNLGQGYNSFESISCPGANFCAASDNAGDILSSTNPTGGATAWSVERLPTGPTGSPPYPISSLSCGSSNLCAGIAGDSLVISTEPTGGAAAWKPAAILDSVSTVSCPSPNLCIAGGLDGAIHTSTAPADNAAVWRSTQLGVPPTNCGKYGCSLDPIKAVSCASEQLCAATDGSNLWSSTGPGMPGATWTKSQMPFTLRVLTCPADNLCVSAHDEEIDATTDPSNPSPTWIVTHLPEVTGIGESGAPSTGLVSSVSCPTTRLCVAVDEVAGYAFTGNPADPNSWTATKIDSPLMGFLLGPRALTGVSCAPSGPCLAVDAAGNVIVGQGSG